MEWLYPLLQAVQVIAALSVIGLVLLQHGRGADMGSAFGAGSAGSVFGAAGAANFLSRTTRWAAIIFFVATAGLAWAVYHPKQKEVESGSVMQGFESVVPGAPAEVGGPSQADEPAQDPSVPTVPGASSSANEGNEGSSSSSSSAVPSAPSAANSAADSSADSAASAPSAEGSASSAQSGADSKQDSASSNSDSAQGGAQTSDSAADAQAERPADEGKTNASNTEGKPADAE